MEGVIQSPLPLLVRRSERGRNNHTTDTNRRQGVSGVSKGEELF